MTDNEVIHLSLHDVKEGLVADIAVRREDLPLLEDPKIAAILLSSLVDGLKTR